MANRHMQRPDRPVLMDDAEVVQALADMVCNDSFNTGPVLMKDTDNSVRLVTFTEKHLSYLRGNPKVNAANYLTNLRTMTKQR